MLGLAACAPAVAGAAPGNVELVGRGALEIALSRDGNVAAFVTTRRLVPEAEHDGQAVYVGTRAAEGGWDLELVGQGHDGQPADDSALGVALSADGSTVAFHSYATNLVPGDTNGRPDIFVVDVDSGAIERVNVAGLAGQADLGYLVDARPSLSADGSQVAYTDTARLTEGGPLGSSPLVYVRDRVARQTRLVAEGQDAALSGDGRTVAFQQGQQVYAVTDEGPPEVVSRDPDGAGGDDYSGQPAVNHDGSLIAFSSNATNLIGAGNDDNPRQDVFLRDRDRSRTELVSLDDSGVPASGSFAFPSLSDDGRFVAFLADRDPNGCDDEFHIAVRDRRQGRTFRASRTSEGGVPDGASGFAAIRSGPSVAGDGTLVGWPSWGANLGGDRYEPNALTTELGDVEDPDLLTPVGSPRAQEGETLAVDFDVCRPGGRADFVWPVFATRDRTATAGEDYTALASHQVEVRDDETRVRVTVETLDDSVTEPWESFEVVGEPGTVLRAPARATITDDDHPAPGPIYYEENDVIFALDPSGGEPRRITEGRRPALSRDGQRLAFMRYGGPGAESEVWVADADGSREQRVLVGGPPRTFYGQSRPAWSPDGRKIAFLRPNRESEDWAADVVLIHTGTYEVETVVEALQTPGPTLSFSPDGTKLALTLGVPSEVTLLDLETGDLTGLGPGAGPAYGPGGELAYTRSGDLWMRADESAEPQQLEMNRDPGEPEGWFDARPAFAPDGSAIAYMRSGDDGSWVETLSLRPGSSPVALTPLDGSVDYVAWAARIGAQAPATLSVADAEADEGDPLSFTVSLSRAVEEPVTITATAAPGTASSPADFTARSAEVTIPAGETSAAFPVATVADDIDEHDETVGLTLSGPTGATIADGAATGTIRDTNPLPTVSIGNASAREGQPVRLPITLSARSGRTVTVRLDTADGTANAASGDYTAQSNVTISIPAGQTTAEAVVPTADDERQESDETFTATLTSPGNAALGGATATGTIEDTMIVASLGAAAPVDEDGRLSFPVTLSEPASETIELKLATADGTATGGPIGDFAPVAETTLVFAPGTTVRHFEVTTYPDGNTEPDETVIARLVSGPAFVTFSPATATGVIRDATPRLTIGSATAEEGQKLVFPVRLSRPSTRTITARFRTEDGTAKAGPIGDYAAVPTDNPATLTFAPGETEKSFEVSTRPDGNTEPDETLIARLISGAGFFATPQFTAVGTIRDATPRLTFGNATAEEGSKLVFPVRLSRASSTTITARFRTEDGTAKAGPIGDYAAVPTDNPATLTFAPGETEKSFEVTTRPDGNTEPDETLIARLISGAGFFATPQFTATGTIRDATPRLTIGDATAEEGQKLVFPVRLSRASPTTITARFRTEDGTAVAPGDYTAVPTATPTALIFAPGETEKSFEVTTVTDALGETDETITARLISGAGFFATPQFTATGTITEPEGAPPIERGKHLGGNLVAGTIRVKLPGTGQYVDVGAGAAFPVGATIDATQGTVELVSATRGTARLAAAKVQRARFSGGVFKLRQSRRSPLTTLALAGKGCRRTLHGDGRGAFAVKGRFATATIVRAARWTTTDTCGATRVKVARGAVRVQGGGSTKLVRAKRSLTVRR